MSGVSQLNFFTPSWGIIKNEVYDTICNFFFSKQFPKQFNHTIPLPIPKFEGAIKTSDFLPISLCSTFYKKIAKYWLIGFVLSCISVLRVIRMLSAMQVRFVIMCFSS